MPPQLNSDAINIGIEQIIMEMADSKKNASPLEENIETVQHIIPSTEYMQDIFDSLIASPLSTALDCIDSYSQNTMEYLDSYKTGIVEYINTYSDLAEYINAYSDLAENKPIIVLVESEGKQFIKLPLLFMITTFTMLLLCICSKRKKKPTVVYVEPIEAKPIEIKL